MLGNIILNIKLWYKQNISCRHDYKNMSRPMLHPVDWEMCTKCKISREI